MVYISSSFRKYHSKNFFKIFLVRLFLKNISRLVSGLKDVNKILDAACGEGLVIAEINKKKLDLEIDGFDISENSIDYAKKILPDNKFFIGDILDINLEGNSYDLVMALEVLEHLDNPIKALKELYRVTNKYILISVPFEPWFSLGNFLSGKNIKRFGQDKDHKQFWTKAKIIDLVSKEMDIELIKISFPWIIILAIKHK